MSWYWWVLIGLAIVYSIIAILVFPLLYGAIWALDQMLDTKASSSTSVIWTAITLSVIWPITLYQIFKKDDNAEGGFDGTELQEALETTNR